MKIDAYEFRNAPQELDDFQDDLRDILNFGKLSHQVVDSPPTWKARNGEAVFYLKANEKRWYFHLDDEWKSVAFSTQVVSAWAVFSATNGTTVLKSFNVSSVTDQGAGQFRLTWANTFANAHYSVCAMAIERTGGEDILHVVVPSSGDPSVSTQNESDLTVVIGEFFGGAGGRDDFSTASVIASGNTS